MRTGKGRAVIRLVHGTRCKAIGCVNMSKVLGCIEKQPYPISMTNSMSVNQLESGQIQVSEFTLLVWKSISQMLLRGCDQSGNGDGPIDIWLF